jgi:hypothetical protein
MATGKRLLTVDIAGHHTESVAISPSGRVVAVGGRGLPESNAGSCKVGLWDTLSGSEIRTFDVPQGGVGSLAFTPDGRTLATGGADSTILLWDLTGQMKNDEPAGGTLTSAKLENAWAGLAADAAQADRAIWALTLAPKQSLPFLRKRLRPVTAAEPEKVAKLTLELEDPNFSVRDNATRSLDELGESAEKALRNTLATKLAPESRRRIEQILEKRDKEALRAIRAIEVLEQIGDSEIVPVLELLAKESPNPRVVEAAAAALQRHSKRLALP